MVLRMNRNEATHLLDKEPVGTVLITAVPREHSHRSWVASVHRKNNDGYWVRVSGARAGEENHSSSLAPIIAYNEEMEFIWSLS